MDKSEAVLIIRKLAESLKDQPSQFNFSVKASAVGQKIVSYGGTGLSVSVTGGGPGSTTIGNKVAVSSADVQIEVDAANTAINDQMHALTEALNEIAQQLESQKPDEGKIHKLLESFKDTWVPPLISSVVSGVIGLLPT